MSGLHAGSGVEGLCWTLSAGGLPCADSGWSC